MNAPTLLDIGKFNSLLSGISLVESWKITTSKSDDILWNVILAFLNSFPLSNKNELAERIKLIVGEQNVMKSIENSIEICNPFFDENASFDNEEIVKLLFIFKDRVEKYIIDRETEFRDKPKNFQYLEASSKLLSCNVVLISVQCSDKVLLNVFPVETFSNKRTIYERHISIFNKLEYTSGRLNVLSDYSFSIPKDIAKEKQIQSLKKILKCINKTDISENVMEKICCSPDILENFLISLLKNSLGHIIPLVYKSSYAFLKLSDAGFEIDPTMIDKEGKSSFFHAFKIEEFHLVTLFYHEIVNRCPQTNAAILSPNPVIVDNLLNLRDHLKLLEENSKHEDISGKARSFLSDLCLFNDFLLETCQSILNLNPKINNLYYTKEEYEVLQRKHTILSILEIYKSYFNHTNFKKDLNIDKSISRFKIFYEHADYFDKIDFSSAIMLFDNLFYLREVLPFLNHAYLNVEHVFIQFVLYQKYLKGFEGRNYFVSRFITFQERLLLKRQLSKFIKTLQKVKNTTDDILDKEQQDTIQTSRNLLEIYGLFHIFKVQHYLNAATDVVGTDLKSVLVIERCFQVLGECCSSRNSNSFTRIIALALPKNLLEYFKEIHDYFAYAEPRKLLDRIIQEEDVKLFRELQEDLTQIKELLLPIYSAQKYKMNQFSLRHFLKSFKKACKKSVWEKHENLLPVPECSSHQQWKSSFNAMIKSLGKEISDFDNKEIVLDKNNYSHCRFVIQNMISAIEEVLSNLEEEIAELEEAFKELDNHFQCLESIFKWITKDEKLTKYRKMLVLTGKERKSRFSGIMLSLKRNKSEAIIQGDTGVNNQQSSRLEKTSNILQHSRKPFDIYCTYQNSESAQSIFTTQNEDNNGSSHISSKKENKDTFESSSPIVLHGIEPKPKDTENLEIMTYSEENDTPESTWLTCHNDRLLSDIYFEYNTNQDVSQHVTEVKGRTFIDATKKFFDKYKRIADTLFLEFQDDVNKDFHFKSVEKYCLILKREKDVREKCEVEISKKGLDLERLQNKKKSDELKNMLVNDFMDGKVSIKIHKVVSVRNKNMVVYDYIDDKLLKQDDHKVVSVLSKNIPNNLFESFLNRIKTLKSILIHGKIHIHQLWNRSTDQEGRLLVKEKVKELYLNDSAIQASVEMLFYDCVKILNSKELDKLWKKANHLLNSVNVKHFLVHDFPLLVSLGNLINPDDLSSELVEKMLQLISDEYTIDCMKQVLDQSNSDFSGFMKIMNNKRNKKFNKLTEKIRECDRWKEYALLIPFSNSSA